MKIFKTLEQRAALAFALALAVVALMGVSSQRSINSLIENDREAQREASFINQLEKLFSDVRAAESAQRGVVITEDDQRYGPVVKAADLAVAANLAALRSRDLFLSGEIGLDIADFIRAIERKMTFIHTEMALSRTNNALAKAKVASGEGFYLMEDIRKAYQKTRADMDAELERRREQTQRQARLTAASSGIWVVVDVALLSAVYWLLQRDLKRRQKSAAELAKARDGAMEATRLKSEFLASMSHEIRTPMNGVIGMTGLLLDTGLNKEQRRLAEMALLSANSLLAIINDILDYSKIEAGRMTYEEMDFELQPVVESALDLFALSAHEKGLELAFLMEPSTPKRLRGDAGRLRQILVNLIGNATKFTEKGEILVKAEGLEKEGETAILKLSVQDTGIGVAADILPKLFDAFVQADSSTTRHFGGTGLGLAISKKLSRGMGGDIGVESKPGVGSTFWFTVRMLELPAEADAVTAPVELAGRTVLVVDDNATNRLILERQLQSWGVVPLLAASAGEAIQALRMNNAAKDVAAGVLDLHMPGMNGLDLALVMKADPDLAQIPLVMLSSGGDDAKAARAAGFVVSLMKPVKQSEVFNALSTAISPGMEAGPTPPEPEPPPASKLKVLLVEDNRVNQMVSAGMLEGYGYRADVAADGAEALEALGRIAYDLIFMDCQMPVMDGYETTRRIRKMEAEGRRRVPIIAMTANAMEGDREKCLAAGMDDYVSKPINRARLQAVMEQHGRKPGFDPKYELNGAALAELRAIPKDGGGSLIKDMAAEFFVEAGKNMEKLRQALAAGDEAQTAARAHALRGSAWVFGATAWSKSLKDMEAVARRNDPAAMQSAAPEVEAGFAATLDQLKKVAANG